MSKLQFRSAHPSSGGVLDQEEIHTPAQYGRSTHKALSYTAHVLKGIPWIRSSDSAPQEAEEGTKTNCPDVLQEQEQPEELGRPHSLSSWKKTHQL